MIKYIFLKIHPTIENIAKEIRGGKAMITDTIYDECSDDTFLTACGADYPYTSTGESELVKTYSGYVAKYRRSLFTFHIRLYKHGNEIIINDREKLMLRKALEKFYQDKKTVEKNLSRAVLNPGNGYDEKKEINNEPTPIKIPPPVPDDYDTKSL